MLPIDIVYHSYCVNDFASILMNKLNKLRMSGLLDACDNFYIVTSKAQERHLEFFEDLASMYSKIKVVHLEDTPIGNECDTFNWLKKKIEDFEQDRIIFYSHSKGVSYLEPQIKHSVVNWVRYMDLYYIYHWKMHIRALQSHDTSGAFMIQEPAHYSGNFWWTKTSHLKKLPLLDNNNIPMLNRGEFWLGCLEGTKMYNMPGCVENNFYLNDYLNIHDFPSKEWI